MKFSPLDGPSAQGTITVDTITVKEVKIGANALDERKVITLQPIDGKIRVFFGDGVTVPNAATVAVDGFLHFKSAKDSYEATNSQAVYILAEAGTVDVKVAERA
jgi:hypothetical protein